MSEYIQIETELSEDGETMYFFTNLPLAEGPPEKYTSPEEMEVGSPISQTLTACEGIDKLLIEESEMAITRISDVEWYLIVEDVSAVLKDFFL